MLLTSKQVKILGTLVAGNGKHEGAFVPCDVDQLIERLDYHPSKESIQFSIRALVNKGLIEKLGTEARRGRRRVIIGPTQLGRKTYVSDLNPTWIPNESDESLITGIPNISENFEE